VKLELHRPVPMLDPRLFTNRAFSAGTLSILVQFFAFFGFVFIALQYLQIVRGDSALIAAVSVLPMAGAMIPMARLAPVLSARIGARRTCVAGLVLIAGALTVLSRLGVGSSYWLFVAGLVPLGLGMGLAMTPATTAITEALPAEQQGVGSAMNDLSRELGGALGIAVIGSVLTAGYRSHLHLPGALGVQARESFAVAAQAGGAAATQARAAFVDGMHVALLVGAGSALVAALAVALLLRVTPRSTVTADPVRAPASV
jgi:Na+/melibiose symporter-like transporter